MFVEQASTSSWDDLFGATYSWAETCNFTVISTVLFLIFMLQLCVHRLVWMEADASGRTGVTAVQGGADTTAPGDPNAQSKKVLWKCKNSPDFLQIFGKIGLDEFLKRQCNSFNE